MSDDFDPFEDDDPGTTAPEQAADLADGDREAAKENGVASPPLVVIDETHVFTKEQIEEMAASFVPNDAIVVSSTADAQEAPDDAEPPEPVGVPLGATVAALGDGLSFYAGELPADLFAVWGRGPESELTARTLIEAWGLDRFRESSLHQSAVAEYARSATLQNTRTDFRSKREGKKK